MRKTLTVTATALVCAGAAGIWGLQSVAGAATDPAPRSQPSAAPVGPTPSPTAVAGTSTAAPGAAAPATASKPAGARPAAAKPAAARPKVLSGKRMVTIVRTREFESGVSMDGGVLTERDDDSGRQRFVPTPAGKGTYLIKAYDRFTDHPASLEPSCWQLHDPRSTAPLSVQAAACDKADPAQRFTISKQGNAYAISIRSAYLQHSPTHGLILEELGDAPLRDVYRLTDIGAGPR